MTVTTRSRMVSEKSRIRSSQLEPALEAALAAGLSELYGHDLQAIVQQARSAPWC